MDRHVLLVKTAKGLEEIKSRAHGLPQKQRAILIMVDGVATVGDLLAKFGGIPEIAAALETLAAQGFVEAKGTSGGVAAAAAAPATAATTSQTRSEGVNTLIRFLRDNLGPDADMVTGNLERARTPTEFTAAAERCAAMLDAVRGKQKGQAFRDLAKAFADAHLAA
jgi:pyruvate/2-oxoglutarate dehydrogenase complex dihydrolipoamide acyltransferase (E2) component